MAAYSNTARVAGTAFFLFCLSLLLISYSARNPGVAGIGSAVFSEVTGPVQLVSHSLYRSVSSLWSDYIGLLDAKQRARDLSARLSALEAENSRLLELENENARLRGILKVTQESALGGVVAEIIGYDPSNWIKAITINKGENEGIRPGMPVLEGDGVVGQIVSASRHVSQALLIIDPGSGVDALVQSTRSRGVVGGAGDKGCEMRYVLREDELNIGDRIVTSGLDGIFPKGLLIGIVSDVDKKSAGLFKEVWLKPAVDFNKVEKVVVITTRPVEAGEK
ncbi:MAG: rod shape-determining protein MreC [Oligoflexia bacterium]|nr:rod shape-determining protein MreC [Oligoflexia bacterium]